MAWQPRSNRILFLMVSVTCQQILCLRTGHILESFLLPPHMEEGTKASFIRISTCLMGIPSSTHTIIASEIEILICESVGIHAFRSLSFLSPLISISIWGTSRETGGLKGDLQSPPGIAWNFEGSKGSSLWENEEGLFLAEDLSPEIKKVWLK